MIICCLGLNLWVDSVYVFMPNRPLLAVKKSCQSSRWQGSNSCTLMSTCKYICANFKLTNMLELIYWLISVTTTASITGWDDRPTPQPIFQVIPTLYWNLFIFLLGERMQKNTGCASSPQLSINLNGKTLTTALFTVKPILSWGQWNLFRNLWTSSKILAEIWLLWFGFSRNRISSNVRTQIMKPCQSSN